MAAKDLVLALGLGAGAIAAGSYLLKKNGVFDKIGDSYADAIKGLQDAVTGLQTGVTDAVTGLQTGINELGNNIAMLPDQINKGAQEIIVTVQESEPIKVIEKTANDLFLPNVVNNVAKTVSDSPLFLPNAVKSAGEAILDVAPKITLPNQIDKGVKKLQSLLGL